MYIILKFWDFLLYNYVTEFKSSSLNIMKSIKDYIRPKVNIMVGRFQPITTGHLKCVNEIQKKTGNPVILCMIETIKTDERHPFPSKFLVPYYKQLPIENIVTVKNADIVKISEQLEDYQISGWVAGTDRYDSYKKMATKYAREADLADDFSMIEIPRTDSDVSASKLRECIKNDDYEGFLKMSAIKDKKYYEGLRKYIMEVQ